ncbi:MAG TPA: class I SAM-dependent methyltransferase [Longimicrobiaceae bacterium]|nr:class I SAM-dependent methyltransferase [Longimicrobiaceae bacterium]
MEHPEGSATAAEPEYNKYRPMRESRADLGAAFARQALATTRPFRSTPDQQLRVLDLGSGYGTTALELARICEHVTGMEPALALFDESNRRLRASGLTNVEFRNEGVDQLKGEDTFDLIVLDNVYEHLPRQADALGAITRALRPGGALYLLTPNRLWPIEAHYGLPFLSYLPLPLANRYLRVSRRGTDYTDASYAPTYWGLRRRLTAQPELEWRFALPGDRRATAAGSPLHYRLGMTALERVPALWSISKALLVVAVKTQAPQGGTF